MARLPKFMQAIKEEVVDPALQKVQAFELGIVTRSYYSEAELPDGELQANPVMLIDVTVTTGDGVAARKYSGVLVPRTFGVQPALPPVGARVLLGFLPENRRQPMAVAIYDGLVTLGTTSDNLIPRTPPGLLLK